MLFSFFNRDPKPYDTGYLPEYDGHNIYYQQFGNPDGTPILSFHGGPGGCSKAKHASHFDLKKHRVILFDQRGCGLSHSKDIFRKNKTKYLIIDAKRVLEHLKIEGAVIIAGGSWGSTLALLFAEKYPERVSKLVLNSIFLADETANNWMASDCRLFYPDFIDRFRAEAGKKNIRPHFGMLMQSESKEDLETALKSYGNFERLLGSVRPVLPEGPFTEEDIKYPKMFFHYDFHNYFIQKNQILHLIKKIEHIPTIIFHNRLDMSCPLCGAWDLHKAMPNSELHIIPSHGHGSKLMFKTMKEKLKDFLK